MNVITLPVPYPFCSYNFSAYAANCPDNNNAMQRENFFLNADLLQWTIFLSPRTKLLTPDWSSGENTRSSLAEHTSSTFHWFLNFVPENNVSFKFFGVRLFKTGCLYH